MNTSYWENTNSNFYPAWVFSDEILSNDVASLYYKRFTISKDAQNEASDPFVWPKSETLSEVDVELLDSVTILFRLCLETTEKEAAAREALDKRENEDEIAFAGQVGLKRRKIISFIGAQMMTQALMITEANSNVFCAAIMLIVISFYSYYAVIGQSYCN